MSGMTVIPESVAAAGMLAAHVAAGAAVGWVCADTLRRGHLMVAFLRCALEPLTRRLRGIVVACSADGHVRRTTAVVPRSAVRATASRRGPPAGLLAPC